MAPAAAERANDKLINQRKLTRMALEDGTNESLGVGTSRIVPGGDATTIVSLVIWAEMVSRGSGLKSADDRTRKAVRIAENKPAYVAVDQIFSLLPSRPLTKTSKLSMLLIHRLIASLSSRSEPEMSGFIFQMTANPIPASLI